MTLLTDEESQGLGALHGMSILDTAPDAAIDGIVRAAARFCDTPVALVSLIDENRQWFKANVAIDGITETLRDIAFCDEAIRGDDMFVVEDASRDARFRGNPLVTGEFGLRFYAGAPLTIPSGACIGTLCVIDRQPRSLSPAQIDALVRLADTVVELLGDRKSATRRQPLVADNRSGAVRRILHHASLSLVQSGAEGFSVRKVAKAANMSLGHLQHYFPTKAVLVHAIVDAMRDDFFRHYKVSIEPIPNPVDRFVACAEHILDQGPDKNMILLLRECWAMATRDAHIGATLSEFYRDCRRLAARILREANPGLNIDDARHRASMAVSLLSGAFLYLSPWADDSSSAGFREYVLAAIVRLPFENLDLAR